MTDGERRELVQACLSPGTTLGELAAALRLLERHVSASEANAGHLAEVLRPHRDRIEALYMHAAEWCAEMWRMELP